MLLLLLTLISEPHEGSPFLLLPQSKETKDAIHFLKTERANVLANGLPRSLPYITGFRKLFRKEGVPENLLWLALIESSFNNEAQSPTGAVGMFQFKADTARLMGLTINAHRDERRHPYAAAGAAARYLHYLYEKFQDWELTLAAYNLGEGDLIRTMRSKNAATWAEVKPFVRQQTQEYLYKVRAAAVLGNAYYRENRNSQLQGINYIVQQGDTLYAIARRFSIPLEQLKSHNGLHSNVINIGQELFIPVN